MIDRRTLITGVGSAAAVAALNKLGAQVPDALSAEASPRLSPSSLEFPRKADFNIADGYTYINGAYTHPMPRVAADAARRAAESRATLSPAVSAAQPDPKALFAKLINASPS